MRLNGVLLLGASLLASAAHAADKPVMQPAPDWVRPVALPPASEKDEAPIRVLLADQQVDLQPGKVATYARFAIRIQTPQGLGAGNLSIPWNPQTDTLYVHSLAIHREGTVIDVLASQSFTVVRREPNLENAMLDGILTANIQPEGLRVGDVLEYAITQESSDPVFKGHVEQVGANWNGIPFERANLRVQWPNDVQVNVRQAGALPPVRPVKSGKLTSFELKLDDVQPIIPPKGAPLRHAMGRVAEFSDFRSWADLGALMAPLYEQAAAVPAQGPLRDELEKIRAASEDPAKRAEAVLALVQDRVRYVALLMGAGGYVPASAEETWSRRFGDCKAKSALLLALLHALGIEAEPVAVNVVAGDGIDQRLPMIGLFNHVLVRARIGGRDYWLDGTRTGDASLARLRTPFFHWGLPLVARNAALVRMVPEPLHDPDYDLAIEIDAGQGLSLPAPVKATVTLRGDDAVETRLTLAGMAADARDATLREYWKDRLDNLEIAQVSATFDQATGAELLVMEGKMAMDWDDSQYWTDWTRVGFDADFSRTEGTDKDAPYANGHPTYSRTIQTIRLPPGFTEQNIFRPAPIDETVAGTEYRRKSSLADNVFTIERTVRSVAPEFAAKDAPAAQKRLKELHALSVSIRRPNDYRLTQAEADRVLADSPKSADAFVHRGNLLLDRGRFGDALADFGDALELEPRNSVALANRALAHVYLGNSKDAEADIEAAGAIDPDNIVLWHARSMIAQAKNDVPGAIKALDRAIAIKADNPWALTQRAVYQFSQGRMDEALGDSARALALAPQLYGLRRLRADIYRGRKDETAAAAEAALVEKAQPGVAAAQIAAAEIYVSLDQHDKAVAAYDRALSITPSPAAYIGRAQSRRKEDRAQRLADIDAALALDPTARDAIIAKADLFVETVEFAQAVKLYDGALATEKPDPLLFLKRGIVHARAGDARAAEKDFAAARGQAKDASWLNHMCWAKGLADVALESALADCDASLAILPDMPPTMDSRAFILLRLGRLDEAIADFDRALAKAPSQSPSLFGRALAWARKGNMEKARADRDSALALDPGVEKSFSRYGLTLPETL